MGAMRVTRSVGTTMPVGRLFAIVLRQSVSNRHDAHDTGGLRQNPLCRGQPLKTNRFNQGRYGQLRIHSFHIRNVPVGSKRGCDGLMKFLAARVKPLPSLRQDFRDAARFVLSWLSSASNAFSSVSPNTQF